MCRLDGRQSVGMFAWILGFVSPFLALSCYHIYVPPPLPKHKTQGFPPHRRCVMLLVRVAISLVPLYLWVYGMFFVALFFFFFLSLVRVVSFYYASQSASQPTDEPTNLSVVVFLPPPPPFPPVSQICLALAKKDFAMALVQSRKINRKALLDRDMQEIKVSARVCVLGAGGRGAWMERNKGGVCVMIHASGTTNPRIPAKRCGIDSPSTNCCVTRVLI